MNRPKFLVIAGGERTRERRKALQRAFGEDQAGAFTIALQTGTVCVFTDRAPPAEQVRSSALLLGEPIPRCGAHRPTTRSVPTSWEIENLISEVWGDYILITAPNDGSSTQIFRSPFGRLACYYSVADGLFAASSHVDLLLEAGLITGALNWTAIRTHLLAPDLRATRTCLENVEELAGGAALTMSDDMPARSLHWVPWKFELNRDLARDQTRAAAELEWIIDQAVTSACAPYTHIMLGVSGGLDSSIVASAASRSTTKLTSITISTDDPMGDERPAARALAQYLGFNLVEEFERLHTVDLRRSSADALPRPVARSFAQSSDEILSEYADSLGVDAFMSGAGGDNIFWNLRSPSMVADRILREGAAAGVFQSAKDLSILANSSFWTALSRGVRSAYRRSAQYEWPVDDTFLSADARNIALPPSLHPWLAMPAGVLPGQKQHIACIMAIENHLEGYRREASRPMLAPLLTQPVVEKCLEIPSWYWCVGGENRALARAAFKHRLPSVLLDRRVKGSPSGFALQLYDANRTFLIEWLRDGLLVEQGLLDIVAIERVLQDHSPSRGLSMLRLLTIADVESWARARSEKAAAKP